ncbi:hypothetical protein, partial [Bradyrhizobium liaoningense]|uniref:hypothetical protein n=1 Tax=Bradyrhizobium liaoningense TaxID=43992 RepID=UPI0024E17DAA
RRLFFVIFAPDSQQESSPLSGRKSTQATVRICGASSLQHRRRVGARNEPLIKRHATTVVFSGEIFQLNQNPIV